MRRDLAALLLALAPGCGGDGASECAVSEGEAPDWVGRIGCESDFVALASEPPSVSIPGARSVKTVIDTLDEDALYFQHSRRFPIHYDFAACQLSGGDLPLVPTLAEFNATEYFSPQRRFLLGAVTRYEGPGVFAYEIAPYDTSTADMIARAFEWIVGATYFGPDLVFHPTSEAVEAEASRLPASVPVLTTDDLFAGIDYQPLNLGTGYGRLRFFRAADLETEYVGFREIVVLDAVPNDISVTSGIVTAEFQTPLSHINVLSQNRGTPNMALSDAFERLAPYEDRWVRLEVGPFDYAMEEVTREEADAWWEEHRPAEVSVPDLDLGVTGLGDIGEVLDLDAYDLAGALERAIPAFGGKASHFSALARMGEVVNAPRAFAIPVFYYRQHMEQNDLDALVDDMLADPEFSDDPAVRDRRLAELRDAIETAPVDPAFEKMLLGKLAADYPGTRMRFRSSTNAEDLGGFTGAGLYESASGDPGDPTRPVLGAVREVWASVWRFRAFEERSYRGIDHRAVGMALLVHRSFPDEEANGVALTANLFDRTGAEPGFYVNVQVGDRSVVQPEPGVTTDQFVYLFDLPGRPIVFVGHSNVIPPGETVLSTSQTYDLGVALDAIHEYFREVYGQDPDAFYAMDVEFKFDGEPGEEPELVVKQARPHPGWGLDAEPAERPKCAR